MESPRIPIVRHLAACAKEKEEKALPAHLQKDLTAETTWSLLDFTGTYHIRNIKNKFPIPGKVITYEMKKEKAAMERWERVKEEETENDKKLREYVQLTKKLAMDTIDFKERASTANALMRSTEEVLGMRREAARAMRGREAQDWSSDEYMMLHDAVRRGDLRAANELLHKEGCDINSRDSFGRTPLITAVLAGNLDTILFLIENGADPNVSDGLGNTPLLWLYDLLKGRDNPSAITQLVRLLTVKRVMYLLVAKGADPNVRKLETEETVLHFAAGHGHLDMVMLLLDNGATQDARNKEGETPRDAAAMNGHHVIATLLACWPSLKKSLQFDEYRRVWKEALEHKGERDTFISRAPDLSTLMEAMACKDMQLQYRRIIRESIPLSSQDDEEIDTRFREELERLALEVKGPEREVEPALEEEKEKEAVDRKEVKPQQQKTYVRRGEKSLAQSSDILPNGGELTFYSRRRLRDLEAQGITIPSKSKVEGKRGQTVLVYDVRGLPKAGTRGEKGRPSDWVPSHQSSSMPPEVARHMLAMTQSAAVKEVKAVQQAAVRERTSLLGVEGHRKKSVRSVAGDAPVLGINLLHWDERMKAINDKLPTRSLATRSVILRSKPLKLVGDKGRLTYAQLVEARVSEGERRAREAEEAAREGEARAKLVSTWDFKEVFERPLGRHESLREMRRHGRKVMHLDDPSLLPAA